MKTRVERISVLILVVAIALLPAAVPVARAQERRVVNLAGTKGLPFSAGIVVGNTLYISGQEGTDDSGKLVAGGIAGETKAALENIQKIAKEGGFDLKDIVSVNVYLADIHDFGEMNTVYRSFMLDPKPTRATIQAAGLVNNARIEVSAIAVKQK